MTKSEQQKLLCAPFKDDVVGVKVQSLSKDKTKALLVLYLQHTDVADRLDLVDPNWEFAVSEIKTESGVDRNGNPFSYKSCKGTLSVLQVARENYGEGETPKEAASDCLKRCAMLFGVGRYLYDQEMAWVPYNEAQDKYKHWTTADIKKSNGGANRGLIGQSEESADPKNITVPAGRDKGKLLSELSEEQIKSDVHYWRGREHSESTPLRGVILAYVLACEELLYKSYKEGSPPPVKWVPPAADSTEDVPF